MFRRSVGGIPRSTLALILLAYSGFSLGQDDSYVNRNHLDYGPLAMSRVEGVARDRDEVVLPGIRVLLFSDPDHKLIAATVTGKDGTFTFGQVVRGAYRLVTKSSFCPANVPIVVSRVGEKKKLYLHMIPGTVDTCSFGDLE